MQIVDLKATLIAHSLGDTKLELIAGKSANLTLTCSRILKTTLSP